MASKRILIETKERRKLRFKFDESGRIYQASPGTFVDSLTKIGEADSLDDAIQIIKASLDDSARSVRVENW